MNTASTQVRATSSTSHRTPRAYQPVTFTEENMDEALLDFAAADVRTFERIARRDA